MRLPLACVFSVILFSSCEDKEDPELLKTYKEQQVILKELQDDLSRARREIEKTQIANPAPDLRKMEAEIKQVKEEKEDLLSKIEALKAQKEAKMKEFENYQKNYPVRSN